MTTSGNLVFRNPSRFRLIYMFILWAVSLALCILIITDFFREFSFQNRHLIFYLLVLLSTFRLGRTYRNYRKTLGNKPGTGKSA